MTWRKVTPICFIAEGGGHNYAIQHYPNGPRKRVALYVDLMHKGDFTSELSAKAAAVRVAERLAMKEGG